LSEILIRNSEPVLPPTGRVQSGEPIGRIRIQPGCDGGFLDREPVRQFFSCDEESPAFACSAEENNMFIAMNRFKVKSGSEEAFEKLWLGRETYLDGMPGFVEFHLLRGPEAENHTLYSSHTVWESKAAFQAWTTSEEFRKAHARAGNETTGSLYLEHPKFEGFEVRQTVRRREAAVA
jgi:heme-degrading monooxygenase HmoA